MSNLLGLEEEKPDVAVEGPETEMPPDAEDVARANGGAHWFYWIAGLSVINSLFFIFGADVAFLAGLGLTQVVEAIVEVSIQNGGPAALKAIAIVFDFIIVVMFALFGYYAGRRFVTAFVIGITIYALDALLLLLLGSFLAAGFHAFALFFIIRGLLVTRKLNAHEATQQPIQTPPPPPTVPA